MPWRRACDPSPSPRVTSVLVAVEPFENGRPARQWAGVGRKISLRPAEPFGRPLDAIRRQHDNISREWLGIWRAGKCRSRAQHHHKLRQLHGAHGPVCVAGVVIRELDARANPGQRSSSAEHNSSSNHNIAIQPLQPRWVDCVRGRRSSRKSHELVRHPRCPHAHDYSFARYGACVCASFR